MRNISNFTSHHINAVRYGSQSLSCVGPRLWKVLPKGFRKRFCKNSFFLAASENYARMALYTYLICHKKHGDRNVK